MFSWITRQNWIELGEQQDYHPDIYKLLHEFICRDTNRALRDVSQYSFIHSFILHLMPLVRFSLGRISSLSWLSTADFVIPRPLIFASEATAHT